MDTKTKTNKLPGKQPNCPKCKDKSIIKNGLVHGEQRWKCKSCQYQYTRIIKRGRPIWQKSLVVFLYSYGVSMHTIAKIFDVRPSTVLKWTRAYAQDHIHIPEENHVHIMDAKEMQNHLQESLEDSSMLFIAINDALFKDSKAIAVSKRKVP